MPDPQRTSVRYGKGQNSLIPLLGSCVLLGGISSGFGYGIVFAGTLIVAAAIYIATFSPIFCWTAFFTSFTCTGLSLRIGGATTRAELLALPFLAILLVRHFRPSNLSRSGGRLLALAAFATWIAIAISSATRYAPEPIASIWITLQIVVGFGCYIAITRTPPALASTFVSTGSLILAVISTYSVAGYFLHLAIPSLPTAFVGLAPDGRVRGLSFESNIMASQTVAWLAVMYSYRQQLTNRVNYLAAPICLASILCGTRAAWLALAILLLYIVFTLFKDRPMAVVGTSFAAALILFFAVAQSATAASQEQDVDSFAWRFTHLLDTTKGTGAYRLNIYDQALEDTDTVDRQLFGAGTNSFPQFHPVDTTNNGPAYLSSVWYALYYDSGLVGLVLFSAIFIALLWITVRSKRQAFAVLPILLICASTTNIIWFVYMWTYVGLASVRPNVDTSSEPAIQPKTEAAVS